MRVDFITSNIACAEAAIVSGLDLFIGYPITPSSDLFEYLSEKLPRYGGLVYQAEDEIASINALVGASLAGAKVMTATSGPGFSLMMEGIGLAIMLEAPIVIVNSMRAGPSTGIATQIGQGDIMQSRWGSHGPHNLVVYAPSSAQETFNFTIKAFNIASMLRVPTIILLDAVLSHTREKVLLKDKSEVEVVECKKPRVSPDYYRPFEPDGEDLVPPLATFGDGYRVLMESLAHDERGYYSTDPEVYNRLVYRLVNKINRNVNKIVDSKRYLVDDAEILFVSYGSLARSTLALIKLLRAEGIKAGLYKPISVWPLDVDNFVEAAEGVEKVVTMEINQGQLVNVLKNILWDNGLYGVDLFSLPILTPELPNEIDLLRLLVDHKVIQFG